MSEKYGIEMLKVAVVGVCQFINAGIAVGADGVVDFRDTPELFKIAKGASTLSSVSPSAAIQEIRDLSVDEQAELVDLVKATLEMPDGDISKKALIIIEQSKAMFEAYMKIVEVVQNIKGVIVA